MTNTRNNPNSPIVRTVDCDEAVNGVALVQYIRHDDLEPDYTIGNCFACGNIVSWDPDEREWVHN